MKPYEFWNSTYREINVFIQVHLIKLKDDLKREINLQEAVTNKLIKADAMSNKRPKIEPIRDSYKDLFKKEQQIISPEEIIRKMRGIIESEKNK